MLLFTEVVARGRRHFHPICAAWRKCQHCRFLIHIIECLYHLRIILLIIAMKIMLGGIVS